MRDDVLLFLSQAETSIPPLLAQIHDFGKLSGYTVNWQKCEIMPLNEDTNLLRHIPVKVPTQFYYLDTVTPKQRDQLYTLNYKTLVDKTYK